MSKISSPVVFSSHWNIAPELMDSLGLMDPLFNVDTALSIDPLLLSHSQHLEFSDGAHKSFYDYFARMIPLLRVANASPRAKKAALKFMQISEGKEIQGTCLGYGAGTIHGHAVGPKKAAQMVEAAIEIVGLGVEDPNLFMVVPLLEDGIGPDLIGDISTSIILKDLIRFNNRINSQLGLEHETKDFVIKGEVFCLLENPCELGIPILLVPKDILRNLPIASDWAGVCEIAALNADYRERVSRHIGEIWKTKVNKESRRELALSNNEAFEVLLDLVLDSNLKPYDFNIDPKGEIGWHKWLDKTWEILPAKLSTPREKILKSYFQLSLKLLNTSESSLRRTS